MSRKDKIFLIDDDELIISMLARSLKSEGYETRIETHPEDIISKIENWGPDVVLLDIGLPGRNGLLILQDIIDLSQHIKVVMLTADNTAEMAIRALKAGATDYLTKPFNTDEIKIVIANILAKERLLNEVDLLRRDRSRTFSYEMVVETGSQKELLVMAERLAAAKVKTILITGESGTGKELMARHIHKLIHPEDTPANDIFVTINCTTLPDHLFESELFGHVKGAFTDAKSDRKGLFELADGGSILLDEIGDIKEGLQAKLLRVLEERKIRKVGGKSDQSIDVTVIATTNRDLAQSVEDGSFRRDLFYRLNTFPLHLHPLRQRKASIPSFLQHFLTMFNQKYNRADINSFSPEAEKILCDYNWPGNVRELKNVVERIVVLTQTPIINPEHLPMELIHGQGSVPEVSFDRRKGGGRYILPDEGINLEEFEKDLYRQALEKAGQNRSKAATLLNVTYDTFRYHAKKYNFE